MKKKINKAYKNIDSYQLRNIQLNILNDFISKCSSNDIMYFMAYGSMLGTIRHHGFIPWDDDVDVMVFRKDIPLLFKLFTSGKYKIINCNIDKIYFSPLIKIYDSSTLLIQDYGQVEGKNIGVYIDVFVLDFVPIDEKKRFAFYKKAQKYRFQWALSCRGLKSKSRNIVYWIVKTIIAMPFRIIGYHHFATRYDRFASSYKDEGFYGIVVYSEAASKEYVYSKNDLDPILMPFEHMKVHVPKSYDAVLKKCYGNYMQLPPESQRKKHKFEAYYISDLL